jgi:hypothetical protein
MGSGLGWAELCQVDYLIHRLDGVPQETIDAWMSKASA